MKSHSKKPQPGVVINPPASLLGIQNAIVWGKATQHHVSDFPGPLSIKTVVGPNRPGAFARGERREIAGEYLGTDKAKR